MRSSHYDDLIFKTEALSDLRRSIDRASLDMDDVGKAVCNNIGNLFRLILKQITGDFQRVILKDLEYQIKDQLVVTESRSFEYSVLNDRGFVDINKEIEYKEYIKVCRISEEVCRELGIGYTYWYDDKSSSIERDLGISNKQVSQTMVLTDNLLNYLTSGIHDRVDISLKKILKK